MSVVGLIVALALGRVDVRDAEAAVTVRGVARAGWDEAVAAARAEAQGLRAEALARIDGAGSDLARADAITLLGYAGEAEDVPLLVGFVRDGSDDVALAAVVALGRLDHPDATAALVSLLDEPRWAGEAMRGLGGHHNPRALGVLATEIDGGRDVASAADALARQGTPEAAAILVEAFGEAGPNEAYVVAEALASYGHDDATARETLYRAAEGDLPHRRAAALFALAGARDPDVFPMLARAAEHPHRRPEIVQALAALRDPRGLPILERLALTGGPSVAGMALYGMASIPGAEGELIDIARHASNDLAQQAVWALPDVSEPRVLEALVDLADTGSTVVRDAAISRLINHPWPKGGVPPEVLDLARDRVSRPTPYASTADAWMLLLTHGDADDREMMEDALATATQAQRVSIIQAIAMHDAPWARELVLSLLEDGDPQVVQYAMDLALGYGDSALPRIERALLARLDDPQPWAAQQGLARIGTPRAMRALFDQVRDGTADTATNAVNAIASWGDADAVEALVAMMDDIDDPARRNALYGALLYRGDIDTEALALQALDEADPSIRAMATSALARSGTKQSRERLRDLVEDDDPSVRASALGALAELGADEAEPIAIAALDDPDLASTAIGTLASLNTPSARKALIRAAKDDDPMLRQQALYALGSYAVPGGEDVLLAAADDEDAGVRSAAVGGLQSLGTPRAAEALASLLDADLDDPESLAQAQQAAYALQGLGGRVARDHQQRIDEILQAPSADAGVVEPYEPAEEGDTGGWE